MRFWDADEKSLLINIPCDALSSPCNMIPSRRQMGFQPFLQLPRSWPMGFCLCQKVVQIQMWQQLASSGHAYSLFESPRGLCQSHPVSSNHIYVARLRNIDEPEEKATYESIIHATIISVASLSGLSVKNSPRFLMSPRCKRNFSHWLISLNVEYKWDAPKKREELYLL